MELMQWNFFFVGELLGFNLQTKKLSIDYEEYHETIEHLLGEVLEIQYQGDKAAADRFIERYTSWDERLHGVVAKNIREQQRYRFRLFKYAALGE
jgi:hypothetical protein